MRDKLIIPISEFRVRLTELCEKEVLEKDVFITIHKNVVAVLTIPERLNRDEISEGNVTKVAR